MITFLIPTYNEKKNIYLFINTISNLNFNLKYNILFVDDNSDDGTLVELKKAKNEFKNIEFIDRTEKNRDLTQSLVFAIDYLKEKYTLVMDLTYNMTTKKYKLL